MSIEQTNKVDAIGIENETGCIVLTLIDDLGWEDEECHLSLLQEKLNAYLRFIESGEIIVKYPAASGRKYSISIIAQFEPPHTGFQFLQNAQHAIERAGFSFNFEVRKA